MPQIVKKMKNLRLTMRFLHMLGRCQHKIHIWKITSLLSWTTETFETGRCRLQLF